MPESPELPLTGQHTIKCPPRAFNESYGSIQCGYELGRNGVASIADARDAFYAMIEHRLGIVVNDEMGRGGATPRGGAVTLTSYVETQAVIGPPKVEFTVGYTIKPPATAG